MGFVSASGHAWWEYSCRRANLYVARSTPEWGEDTAIVGTVRLTTARSRVREQRSFVYFTVSFDLLLLRQKFFSTVSFLVFFSCAGA